MSYEHVNLQAHIVPPCGHFQQLHGALGTCAWDSDARSFFAMTLEVCSAGPPS